MTDLLDIMLKPLVACIILAGIHAYLGLHVVKRGVIFVDLALAQVAAFGATVGIFLGWGLHSSEGYLCSLAFTMVGAIVLALTRFKEQLVPQEALIGIVYVVAAAASVLVLSRAPEGGEELKNLLVGHLLFIEWPEIVKILVIYLLVALIHIKWQKPLLRISEDPAAANRSGINVLLWDLVFYGTFGLVVTSSTEVAGVLLVFSFLIVPAVCGALLAGSTAGRLMVGWICGVTTSILGIIASYYFDFPTGAMIVCTFGVTLIVCGLIKFIPRAIYCRM